MQHKNEKLISVKAYEKKNKLGGFTKKVLNTNDCKFVLREENAMLRNELHDWRDDEKRSLTIRELKENPYGTYSGG